MASMRDYDNETINQQVANCVDNARIEHDRRTSSEVVVPGQDEAQKKAHNAVIEAKKFKASIATPKGNNEVEIIQNQLSEVMQFKPQKQLVGDSITDINQPVMVGGVGVQGTAGISDDDFFHLICHIDQSLKEKIALCGLRWFKLNMSKCQKMSSCQKDVKCQIVKHLDYGGGSQKK